MEFYLRFVGQVFVTLLGIWYLWLPIVLFLIFWRLLTALAHQRFLDSLEWALLEVRVPRDLERTPKAMQQVLRSLHGIYRQFSWWEKNVKGEMGKWFSFEIVGIDGAVHFFIRTPKEYRGMIESNLYGHYPDAEIAEVKDYVDRLPDEIPSNRHDVWGTEFILTKEDVYPILTYRDFEEGTKEEEQIVDPLAAVAETLSIAGQEEGMWMQILVQPTGSAWQKEGRDIIDAILGKEKAAKGYTIVDRWLGIAPAPKEKKEQKKLSPGEQDIVKALERNISQPGFHIGIRFVYWAPTASFDRANIAAAVGALKQYNTDALNGFKPNKHKTTKGTGLTKRAKAISGRIKKRSIIEQYKDRALSDKPFVLTTEELATIFHFPRLAVDAPTIQRVETKQAPPPPDLPTA